MIKAGDEEELFALFIKWAAEVEADTVSVSLIQGEGQESIITVKNIWSSGEKVYHKGEQYRLEDFFLEPLITRPETIVLESVESDTQLSESIRQELRALNVHSMIIIPILVQHRVVGTVHITYKQQARVFSQNQVRLFESLVHELTIIWQNLNLLASIERRLRRERIIREVTSKIHAATGVERVLQTTVTELSKAFDVPQGIVQLHVNSAESILSSKGISTDNQEHKND
jgi:GAF domain-containing protein